MVITTSVPIRQVMWISSTMLIIPVVSYQPIMLMAATIFIRNIAITSHQIHPTILIIIFWMRMRTAELRRKRMLWQQHSIFVISLFKTCSLMQYFQQMFKMQILTHGMVRNHSIHLVCADVKVMKIQMLAVICHMEENSVSNLLRI